MPTFRETLLKGAGTSIGAWSNLTDELVAHAVAQAGFDWICIDEQHGSVGASDTMRLLTAASAAGAEAFVRVPWNRPELIGRALDGGASGVIVPMVQSASEAAAAVAACRYAPLGRRSWGPARTGYSLAGLDVVGANSRIVCLVMVESPDAVDNVEEIAAVEGLDGIFVGPFDLSIALGVPVDELLADGSESSALSRIVAACRDRGIVAGAYAGSLERAETLVALGFTMVAVVADSELLTDAAQAAAAAARAALG